MKKNQRFQALVKEKVTKNGKIEKGMPSTSNPMGMPIYDKEKENSNGGSIDIRINMGRNSEKFSALLQDLKIAEEDRGQKFMEIINLQMKPYEIPAMYSLEFEGSILHVMEKRLDIISKNMFKTETESISFDWKQIGGDINNAICKYRGCYVEKNGC